MEKTLSPSELRANIWQHKNSEKYYARKNNSLREYSVRWNDHSQETLGHCEETVLEHLDSIDMALSV